MSGNKITFASQAQDVCNSLGQALNDCDNLFQTFFDRGYNSGGGDQIIDADIASLKITAADLGSFINLAEQINKLMNNQATTQADWFTTVNKMRTDI